MRKDFSAKKYQKRQRAKRAGRRYGGVALFSMIVFTVVGAFIFYFYKQTLHRAPFSISPYFSLVTAFIEKHKTHEKTIEKSKKPVKVAEKNEQAEVHFEFYTALPKMLIDPPTLSDSVAESQVNKKIHAMQKPTRLPVKGVKD